MNYEEYQKLCEKYESLVKNLNNFFYADYRIKFYVDRIWADEKYFKDGSDVKVVLMLCTCDNIIVRIPLSNVVLENIQTQLDDRCREGLESLKKSMDEILGGEVRHELCKLWQRNLLESPLTRLASCG